MKSRVIAFIDHEIGFRLLKKMLSETSDLELVAAVTTAENGKLWWEGVESICNEYALPLFRYEEPFINSLEFEDIDWYFLLSWKHLISNELISHPKKGVINLHYSLLPDYRGVYPVNWAIIDGKKTTGITYHLVDGEIDHGPIIIQESEPILSSDTARSLQLRLDDLAFKAFDSLCAELEKEKADLVSQAERKQTTSYKSRKSFDQVREINLESNYKASDLINLLRGMSFLADSKNVYFVDPETLKKVYITINLKV